MSRKATIAAVIAVALLGAGVGEAARLITSAMIQDGTIELVDLSQSTKDALAGPVVLWAVVNVDGTLARGSGAVSSENVGTDGVYFVSFNRDVSQCSYQATAGEATTFPPDDAITFGVSASDRGNANEVSLIEYDAILGADAYSSGFHLAVFC